MPIGSASSQRFRDGGDLSSGDPQPPKKKSAPVDTTRLKSDIDFDKLTRADDIANRERFSKQANNDKADIKILTGNDRNSAIANEAGNSMMSRRYNKFVSQDASSIAARSDTLAKARAGKIPAKP